MTQDEWILKAREILFNCKFNVTNEELRNEIHEHLVAADDLEG